MKKTVNFITVAVMAIMLSSAGAYAQDVSVKAADEKKKQEELQKQAELQKKDEYQKQADLQKKAEYQKQKALDEEMKLKQAEIEAKRKGIQGEMA